MSLVRGLARNRRSTNRFLPGQANELGGHRLMRKAASSSNDMPISQSNAPLVRCTLCVVTVSCELALFCSIWLMDVLFS